eukprot:5448699-Alexandrium_andersonii.AAC.1
MGVEITEDCEATSSGDVAADLSSIFSTNYSGHVPEAEARVEGGVAPNRQARPDPTAEWPGPAIRG